VTFFTPFPASAPCLALPESPKLRAKQGHAKSAKRGRFLAFSFLKFRIPHFAFPNQIPPFRPLREQSAFTLVELLAVVGIMGLLAAVAVPALKGLTGSGGRKQALSQLMGALEIARNTAISTGTNAAVIFPDSTFASGEAYKYRSMAVVAWNATNSATPATMVGSWIVLPQGISFLPKYLKTNTTTNMISVTANIQIPPKTNSTAITCPGIIFQTDGGLLETNSIPLAGVAFFEGTITDTDTTNPTTKMTNFETVRLTRYTGRALPTLAP
jgi:hypothetical protein